MHTMEATDIRGAGAYRKPFRLPPKTTAAVIVVAIALAASWAYVANYQPLEPGSLAALGPGDCETDRIEVAVLNGGSGEMITVSCKEPGEMFRWRRSMRNTGPLGITLTKVTYLTDVEGCAPLRCMWTDIEVRQGGRAGSYTRPWEEAVPIETLDFAPGDDHFVYFSARSDNCIGTITTGFFVELTYKVLGITRTDTFPMFMRYSCG